MHKTIKILYSSLLIFFLCSNFSLSQEFNDTPVDITVEREFRAAWIATVANINWPSSPGLSIEEQKAEAVKLLDLLKNCNYNAAIFQVRPQADAMYKSELEPWSYFLTGNQGIAPDDYYDPLEFWIEEAHKRCIELHAWINPYRAHHKDGSVISEYSLVKQKPDLIVELKEGYWWFDPSLEETQDHVYTVVMDIARRYDVDGIHFDDYFYPYPSYNENIDFPDHKSWEEYLENDGSLSRADWRRNSVNKFVERIYTNLKLMKPHVKFGLSPFGIWRPNNPQSIKGFDQYDKLYADAKLWLNKGWIDYFSPQLYWTINDIDQSFPVLLNWWNDQNFQDRHLWPGSNIAKGQDEVINQIMIIRGMMPDNPGNVHWSIAPLVENAELSKELNEGPFKKQALIPSSPWIWNKRPQKPKLNVEFETDQIQISVLPKSKRYVNQWILYTNYGEKWNYEIKSLKQNGLILPLIKKKNIGQNKTENNSQDGIPLLKIGVSIVDRFGNESEIVYKNLKSD